MDRNSYRIADCLDVLPTLPEESVDLILTDPPYGMDYQSSRRAEKIDRIQNDEGALSWLCPFFAHSWKVLKPNRHMYVFCSWKTYPGFHAQATKFFDLKGLIVWDKMTHGTGDLYGGFAPMHEFVMFLSKGRRLWDRSVHGDNSSQVSSRRQRPMDILRCQKVPPNEMNHPTEKPVPLLRCLIEQSTDPGELVLDPYAGSFSTARACKAIQFGALPNGRQSDRDIMTPTIGKHFPRRDRFTRRIRSVVPGQLNICNPRLSLVELDPCGHQQWSYKVRGKISCKMCAAQNSR